MSQAMRTLAGAGIWTAVIVVLGGAAPCWAQTVAGDLSFPTDQDAAMGLSVDEALGDAAKIITALEKYPDAKDPELQEQFNEATRLANYALGRDPLNKTAGYLLARLSLLSGRPREAMDRIEKYVGTSDNPGPGWADWYAHKLLGTIRLGSYPQLALPEFKYAVELAPGEPEAVIGLAKAHLKLNHASEAVDHARRAILLDREGLPEYRVVLAEALLLDNQAEEANKVAREAIELGERKIREKPGDATLLAWAKEYYKLQMKCLEQLLRLRPDDPGYTLQYVQVWQDRADLDRLIEYHSALLALEKMRKGESFKPTPELLLEEARLDRIVGRAEQALALLEQIIADYPDFAPAREMLELLEPAPAPETPEADPTASASP